MYSNNEKILNYKRGVVHVDGCPSPPLPSSPLSIFVNYQISGLSLWTISVVFHFSVSQLNLIEIGIHERLLTV